MVNIIHWEQAVSCDKSFMKQMQECVIKRAFKKQHHKYLWCGDIIIHVYIYIGWCFTDCGTIGSPTNGGVTFVPGTLYQGKAEFTCDTGYTLNGDPSRTCLDTGVWGGSSPMCVINGMCLLPLTY